jgi:AraC-like DNA-binding protein
MGPALDTTGLDHFLDALDVRVEAFATCAIGREFNLRCPPLDHVILHFVIAGEGMLQWDSGEHKLTAGTLVIVPKGLAKSLRGLGPIEQVRDADSVCPIGDGLGGFRAFGGHADLVLGCAMVSATVGGELPTFDHLRSPLVRSAAGPLLHGLFTAMIAELREPGLGTRAFVSALMKQILIVMVRLDDEAGTSLLPLGNGRLASAVALVLQRPQDEHSVGSLAAHACMSRARFCHHFAAVYDCSPKAFVRAARLASAARLLRASDLPVKWVAASVGYASRSHFSRAFQSKYGVGPSAFRQALETEQ